MKDLITPKEIEQWRPASFNEIVGCDFAKSCVSNAINSAGDVPNIMVTGMPGSGKTSLVRLASKAALCLHPSHRPCGNCEKCINVDTRFSDCGVFVALDVVVRNYHVLDCSNVSQAELTEAILQLGDTGSHIVVLDEAQGLRRQQMDCCLLEPIERFPRTTWIASTAYPKQLDPMFMRRFSVRVKTAEPTFDECESFIVDKCMAWSIKIEDGACNLLAHKSMRNVSEVLRVLSIAASTQQRMLSLSLIREFPFLELNDGS